MLADQSNKRNGNFLLTLILGLRVITRYQLLDAQLLDSLFLQNLLLLLNFLLHLKNFTVQVLNFSSFFPDDIIAFPLLLILLRINPIFTIVLHVDEGRPLELDGIAVFSDDRERGKHIQGVVNATLHVFEVHVDFLVFVDIQNFLSNLSPRRLLLVHDFI